jgi:hypothetical protein
MRNDRRLGRGGDAVRRSFRVGMAEVERDADLVHLGDRLAA